MMTPQGLPTGITKIIATGTSHMSAPLCLLNNLTTFTALSILFSHFKLNGHSDLTLSLMSQS